MKTIDITPAMIRRSTHTALSDPCIICGGKFGADFDKPNNCGHTTDETMALLALIKAMPKAQREAMARKP